MQNTIKKTLLALGLSLLWVGQAPAQTVKLAPDVKELKSGDELPGLLSFVINDKSAVIGQFDAGDSMTGWLLRPGKDGRPSVIYTNKENTRIYTGDIYSMDDNGQPIHLSALHENKMKTDWSDIWGAIEKGHWVRDGAPDEKAKKIIYGFFDPNCIYCHHSWMIMHPYFEQGLQIRWLMVGFLSNDSPYKAAAILQSDNPSQLMKEKHLEWERKGSNAFEEVSVEDMNPQSFVALKKNMELMKKLKITGTPGFVYKNDKDEVVVTPGLLRNSLVAHILGVEPVKIQSTVLKQFE